MKKKRSFFVNMASPLNQNILGLKVGLNQLEMEQKLFI